MTKGIWKKLSEVDLKTSSVEWTFPEVYGINRGRDAENLRGILLERYANPAYFSGDEALLAAAESLYEHMNIREIGEKDGLRYYLCWFNAEEYLSLLGQSVTGSEYPDEYQELMAGNEKRADHRSVPGCRGRGDDG